MPWPPGATAVQPACSTANRQIYTVWNYRREALEPVFEAGGEAAQKASNEELALTQVRLAVGGGWWRLETAVDGGGRAYERRLWFVGSRARGWGAQR
jgi:hypothetical protein